MYNAQFENITKEFNTGDMIVSFRVKGTHYKDIAKSLWDNRR